MAAHVEIIIPLGPASRAPAWVNVRCRRCAKDDAPGLRLRRRRSARGDEHVDREVLRRSALRRRAAHDLCERRAELLLHEALESLTRLPDVVDVVALLALTGAVDDQPVRR